MNPFSPLPGLNLRLLSGYLLSSCLLSGCTTLTQRGFRTQGTYVANQSGYRMEIITQGVNDTGEEAVVREIARMQICPLRADQGRPLRLSLAYERGQSSLLVSEDASIPPIEWNWRSRATALDQVLRSAGYLEPNLDELNATANIMEDGIYVEPLVADEVMTVTQDANGQSQIQKLPADEAPLDTRVQRPETLVVLNQTEDYAYPFNHSQPMNTWIDASEFAACMPPSSPSSTQ